MFSVMHDDELLCLLQHWCFTTIEHSSAVQLARFSSKVLAFPRNSSVFLSDSHECVFIMVHLCVKTKRKSRGNKFSVCYKQMPSALVGLLLQCQLFTDACLLPCFFRATSWLRWVLLQTVEGTRKRKLKLSSICKLLTYDAKKATLTI